MLPSDSPKSPELDTVFGKPEDVPKVLAEWSAALGFDQAATIYTRDLFNLYLHQRTITNLAFAVVPGLDHHCLECEPIERANYLTAVPPRFKPFPPTRQTNPTPINESPPTISTSVKSVQSVVLPP